MVTAKNCGSSLQTRLGNPALPQALCTQSPTVLPLATVASTLRHLLPPQSATVGT